MICSYKKVLRVNSFKATGIKRVQEKQDILCCLLVLRAINFASMMILKDIREADHNNNLINPIPPQKMVNKDSEKH